MKLFTLAIALSIQQFLTTACHSEVVRFGTPANDDSRIVIWGATDLQELKSQILRFIEIHPDLSIEYHDMQSGDLYEALIEGKQEAPDFAISSAADLQVKLVNDGLAQAHQLRPDAQIPGWANWRNEAFGITAEPVAIVYSRKLIEMGPLPRSRSGLIRMLSQNPELFRRKIATYDIEASGVGYLFATQDSLYSGIFTKLMQSLGNAEVRLYCCSADMLDALDNGSILVGYNVLASYALARQQKGSKIEIVLPEDYTIVLSRVGLIPAAAKRPDLAGAFLDFLLSAEGQAMSPGFSAYGTPALPPQPGVAVHPIVLNPALLVFLDQIKRKRFISNWGSLVRRSSR